MCGIAGILHFDASRTVDKEVLWKMTEALKHRGPDGEGFHVNRNIGLGHRRLSIIDLEGGEQPMTDASSQVTISYNGEIYNYIELRQELVSLGYAFRTNSDTEVILKAYCEWGEQCLEKLNGMWAFALWDNNKQKLFLSRDRMGEKPLYYTVLDNTFLFASEIKSLLKYGVEIKKNLEFLEVFMSLGYLCAPDTFYNGVKQLEPGHYLSVTPKGVEKNVRYWDLPEIDERDMLTNKSKVHEEFEAIFKDSIRIRMRSDVSYGAFLSGGLDSSSIVALMSEISSKKVKTFTIGFEDKAFDESKLAQLVAEAFDTNHSQNIATPDTFEYSLQKVIDHHDEPFADVSSIATGMVSSHASQKVKMVLTGDGGDEVLSGYTTYQGELFASQYAKVPALVRNSLPFLLDKIRTPLRGSLRYKMDRVLNVINASKVDFDQRLISKSEQSDSSVVKKMLSSTSGVSIEEYMSSLMSDCPYKDNFYKLMFFNLKYSLPGRMLTKVDRMSMAYSLETRVPFLDYRLIDLMVKVDKHVKMAGYERKSVLRSTVGQRLPKALLKASKMGFGVPVREWFKEPSFDGYLNDLKGMDLGINGKELDKVILDNRLGKKDFGNLIWSLVVLKKWMN